MGQYQLAAEPVMPRGKEPTVDCAEQGIYQVSSTAPAKTTSTRRWRAGFIEAHPGRWS